MQICVTATRNFPHPIKEKVMLTASVSLTDEFEFGDSEGAAKLRLRAEEIIEDHVDEVTDMLKEKAQHEEMLAEFKQLDAKYLHGALTTQEVARHKQLHETLSEVFELDEFDPEKPIPFEMTNAPAPLLENTVTQATETTTAAAASEETKQAEGSVPTSETPPPAGEPEPTAAS